MSASLTSNFWFIGEYEKKTINYKKNNELAGRGSGHNSEPSGGSVGFAGWAQESTGQKGPDSSTLLCLVTGWAVLRKNLASSQMMQ